MHARFMATSWLIFAVGLITAGCNGPPLVIEPTELPAGVEGSAYLEELTTDGNGGESWSVDSGQLPAGLHLGTGTGVIAGTPQEAGTFSFAVRAHDTSLPPRAGQRAYFLTVVPELHLISTLPSARVDVPYSVTLDVTGGVPPYQFDVVGLPAGMTSDPVAGTISGTPINAYTSLTLEITVTDSGSPPQSVTRNAVFRVLPRAVSISTEQLPGGQVNVPYSEQLSAEGGQPPLTWAVTAGYLGDDLRLNTRTGVISGTPRTARTITVTIEVNDAESPPSTASKEFTFAIVP